MFVPAPADDASCCRMDVSGGNETSVVSGRGEGAHMDMAQAGVLSLRTKLGVVDQRRWTT